MLGRVILFRVQKSEGGGDGAALAAPAQPQWSATMIYSRPVDLPWISFGSPLDLIWILQDLPCPAHTSSYLVCLN